MNSIRCDLSYALSSFILPGTGGNLVLGRLEVHLPRVYLLYFAHDAY